MTKSLSTLSLDQYLMNQISSIEIRIEDPVLNKYWFPKYLVGPNNQEDRLERMIDLLKDGKQKNQNIIE